MTTCVIGFCLLTRELNCVDVSIYIRVCASLCITTNKYSLTYLLTYSLTLSLSSLLHNPHAQASPPAGSLMHECTHCTPRLSLTHMCVCKHTEFIIDAYIVHMHGNTSTHDDSYTRTHTHTCTHMHTPLPLPLVITHAYTHTHAHT